MRTTVTVVIPIHNEAAFLPVALPGLRRELDAVPAQWDLILVENGSVDGTAEVAEQAVADWPAQVLRHPVPDYGASMRAGCLAAKGDYVVTFDIDYFSGDFLTKALAAGADVVIASKRDPDSTDRRPLLRRLATSVFNLLLRLLLSSKVSDTHGMKLFARRVVETIGPAVVSRQDLFDTELVLRAERAGLSVVELPVVVEEMREAKSSLFKRAPRTVLGLWRIRRIFRTEGI